MNSLNFYFYYLFISTDKRLSNLDSIYLYIFFDAGPHRTKNKHALGKQYKMFGMNNVSNTI